MKRSSSARLGHERPQVARVVVGPVGGLAFDDLEQHLLGRAPRVVGRERHAGGGVPEHERPAPLGVRRRELHRETAAVVEAEDRRLLDPGGVHHRDHVGDLGVVVGEVAGRHRIREPGAAPVEDDQATDRREAPALAGDLRDRPERLDVVHPALDLDDVDRTVTELLVRQVGLAVAGVPGLRCGLHRESLSRRRPVRPTRVLSYAAVGTPYAFSSAFSTTNWTAR